MGRRHVNQTISQNESKSRLDSAEEKISEETCQPGVLNSEKYFSKTELKYNFLQRKIKPREFTGN